jgi:hypothetical protein
VTGATSGAGFNVDVATSPTDGTVDLEQFFFALGDDGGITGNGTEFSSVVGSLEITCQGEALYDPVYISFNVLDPLPAVHDGATDWTHQWQYPIALAKQFKIGQGNPGDSTADWGNYHGYELNSSLILHQVPEPTTLGLLVLGGLLMVRRRQ